MKPLQFVLPLMALVLSGMATAGSRDPIDSVIVRYGDLDLNSAEGPARLHRRIRNAARSVCGGLESTTIGLRLRFRHCVADTIADAVEKVGNENLSIFHASRRKGAMVASN
jgi:UrcA family protein